MRSPAARNAQQRGSLYGISLQNLMAVDKGGMWSYLYQKYRVWPGIDFARLGQMAQLVC